MLEVESFEPGWELQDPVARIVTSIYADLDDLEAVAAEVLTTTFGATFDLESLSWPFPENLWPISSELASLEVLSLGVYEYRDTILPLMLSMTDRTTAIEHWNQGASPCGHAYSLGLKLETARAVLSP